MNTEYYCIITINDPTNYGNRLQNYALQQALKSYGPTTTVHQYLSSRASYIKSTTAFNLKRLLSPVLSHFNIKYKKLYSFLTFENKYMDGGRISDSVFSGVKIKNNISIKKVVIGSDQVWNYTFLPSTDSLELRMGRDFDANKLISYAASIGLDSISPQMQPIFKKYVNRIQALSVRENKARQLVESICDTPCEVVLDPTMLLTADEWRSIFTGCTATKNKYILTYFLGKPNAQQEQVIASYADKHNCEIVRINDPSDPQGYGAGPSEFVEYIANADYVFTDSFHACVFSIIFGKNFKVYNRNSQKMASMNSRMTTLFEHFGLNDTMQQYDVLNEVDYQAVHQKLGALRQKSLTWLDNALLDAH